MSTKKSNISIWKIDKESRLFINNVSAWKSEDFVKYIIIENGLEEISLLEDKVEMGQKEIKIARLIRGKSTGLYSLVEDIVGDDNKKKFESSNVESIIFIYNDNNIFAITSGTAFHKISKYSDDNFPFEIAKRIFSGKFAKAESRMITGSIYSDSSHYRGGDYLFSHGDGFGKVWKNLTGNIDKDVIKKNPDLSKILGTGKKTNLEIKSTVTFRKSVDLDELISIITVIENLVKVALTEKQKKDFAFLDTLKRITDKKEKEMLKKELKKELLSILKSGNFEDAEFLDFAYYKGEEKFLEYMAGEKFYIDNVNNMVAESYPPTAREILENIKKSGIIKINSTFYDSIDNLEIGYTDSNDDEQKDKIIDFFHGEVLLGKETFFYIDKEFYRVSDDFKSYLKENFIEIVFNGERKIFQENIDFIKWKKTKNSTTGNLSYLEADFNKEQSGKKDFYLGDKVLLDNVELFDLLYLESNSGKNTLKIIQVKNKFGGTMRDACSQIKIASEIIENDVINGYIKLKEYYAKWSDLIKYPMNTLSESDFLGLFESDKCKRKYILAISEEKFTEREMKMDNKSNTARFEVLELEKYFRGRNIDFAIENIEKK